jgi:type I restriction enzyme, R subunit
MIDYTKPIAESNHFIVLDKYHKEWKVAETYQSEYGLESELLADLQNQGYEYLPNLKTPEAMLANVRVQLQALNNMQFTDGEWLRFVETYLDKPSDSIVDKKNVARNKVQVISQFEQTGTQANRYDVTILVSGLPLVQVELKKRGVAIREAFNQVHRYSKESFNSEHSLFKYLQLFVISNGTDCRYFANTTHRTHGGNTGFNAMFAVSSVDAAKCYYETFKQLQADAGKPLRVATIFSFAANEEQNAVGEIQDESFEVSAMDSSAKEFLCAAIADYNTAFKTNFGIDSNGFQNYYRDLAKRVKGEDDHGQKLPPEERIDLLIVVGMFLTGFDAPTLNTLFVDKNLRYHGLLQAFSRTNRIYDATKTFGNIITFRDLEQATIEAITLFGDANTKNVVLEKSYKEYMEGFTDIATGEAHRGYVEVVTELEKRFPQPDLIFKEADKKDFAKLFGEYLRIENILLNYDEFATLKALQSVDMDDPAAVEAFKTAHYLSDEDIDKLRPIQVPTERTIQDYCSTYNDIRDWLRREKAARKTEASAKDWDDVVFEVDLLKSQEINLDFILELIFENSKKLKDKSALVDDVRRVIRASIGNRAKESLVVDFINQTEDLDQIGDKASVIEAFFTFAQAEQKREAEELIDSEGLHQEAAKRYIIASLKREYASDNGTELNSILPKMSPLHPQYLIKKQSVFQKVSAFVDKFRGVGGNI